MIKQFYTKVFLTVLTILYLTHSIQAARVAVSKMNITPVFNTTEIQVSNTSNTIKAFEIKMMDRVISKTGVETRSENTSDFLIIPSQVLLGPSTDEFINITYIGKKDIPKEVSYRIGVFEVLIDIEDETEYPTDVFISKFKTKTNVIKSLYLTLPQNPPPSTEDLQIISFNQNPEYLEVEIKNNSIRHGIYGADKPSIKYKITDSENNIFTHISNLTLISPQSSRIDKVNLGPALKKLNISQIELLPLE